MHKHAMARGVGEGGWFPRKFWNLEPMRLHLRPFLGKYNASRRPDNRVSHVQISTLSPHCVVRLSDNSLISQATPFL